MDKSTIVIGKEYAIRERRIEGSPLHRIKLLEHIRHNKWKARWIDPNPGLVDYVESAQIIVLWKDAKAFLKDEANAARLAERNEREGYDPRAPIADAVMQVYGAMGDDIDFYGNTIKGSADAFARIRTRARDSDTSQPIGAYVDRTGNVHWPFAAGLKLAKKFCAAEPSTVLTDVEASERQWAIKMSQPGHECLIPMLNEHRAEWALIRQWTGHDPAVAEREEHIKRLQRLVWDAVYALQKAGLDREAARLRRVLQGM
jgi:hypothetical protein